MKIKEKIAFAILLIPVIGITGILGDEFQVIGFIGCFVVISLVVLGWFLSGPSDENNRHVRNAKRRMKYKVNKGKWD